MRAESLYAARRDRPGAGAGAALWLAGRLWEQVGATEGGREPFADLTGTGDPGRLRREGAQRLAAARAALAEEPDAIRALLDNPAALDDRRRELLREAAGRLSIAELEALAAGGSASPEGLAGVQAALARALALAGRADSAAAAARAAMEGAAEGEDFRLARSVTRGEVERDDSPVRVGAILPLSGPFASVGALLREGVELAVAAHRSGGGRPVELLVLDDSSRAEAGARRLAELERRGAVGVVGPVRSEALPEAARARVYPGVLLVSPTAAEVGAPYPHAYTLWERARRDGDVASDLGAWLASELRLRRVGILYPAGPNGEETFRAFRLAVEQAGGAVGAAVAYDPDSTTFEGPITALAAVSPEAVYVAADGPRTVLQLGPQLSFYGLRAAIIAGGPAWAEPESVRRLDPGFADFRLVATYVDRVTPSPEWAEFQRAYEVTYRKAMPDNLFPALGHDAMALLLGGLPPEGPAPAGAVARAARAGAARGATGELRPDPTTSTVARRTLIRILRGRALAPAVPADILAWAEEARRQEAARVEAARREAEGGEGGAPPAPGP